MVLDRTTRPLARCWRCAHQARSFSISASSRLEAQQTPASESTPPPTSTSARDPNTVSTRSGERQLLREQGLQPIGSRRRRAAIATTSSIPFSQLPYQCFQEARSFLQEDRKEKLQQIQQQRDRIERLKAKQCAPQDEAHKELRLTSMRRRLDELKILADINDPMVKRRFEDGAGDMTKPIYRYLADKQWRAYKRTLLMQRITQMNVVPDVLPAIDPIVSTTLSFSGKRVQHGDFVSSLTSEKPPALDIQAYEKGEKLYTIAVVNPDVPSVQKDGYDYRCHFLASNVRLSPTSTLVRLGSLDSEQQVILSWLPAFAQKGLPYQRMSVFVFEQPKVEATENSEYRSLDVAEIKGMKKYTQRQGFKLRSFADRFSLKPVGVDLFRTQWDEYTAAVMQRAGVPGVDVEFKRKRIEPLPYQRKSSERYR
ncbi:PEBP-like protein [Hortaea werneckii]|nr:PEBP-like protein [Hortaea werneckii]KAI7353258.1 PEBP-like protein [Hortaea werneckii]